MCKVKLKHKVILCLLRPCLDFFLFFDHSSLLTQFPSLITHHLLFKTSHPVWHYHSIFFNCLQAHTCHLVLFLLFFFLKNETQKLEHSKRRRKKKNPRNPNLVKEEKKKKKKKPRNRTQLKKKKKPSSVKGKRKKRR